MVATEAGAPRRSEGEVAKVTCAAAPKIWRTPGSCYARIRLTVAKVSESTFLNLRITASTTRLGARVPRRSGAATENPHGAPCVELRMLGARGRNLNIFIFEARLSTRNYLKTEPNAHKKSCQACHTTVNK